MNDKSDLTYNQRKTLNEIARVPRRPLEAMLDFDSLDFALLVEQKLIELKRYENTLPVIYPWVTESVSTVEYFWVISSAGYTNQTQFEIATAGIVVNDAQRRMLKQVIEHGTAKGNGNTRTALYRMGYLRLDDKGVFTVPDEVRNALESK
jgi:hypothetical protein